MNEPHHKYVSPQLCGWWNDTEITKNPTDLITQDLCLVHKNGEILPLCKQATTHILCCRTGFAAVTDPDFKNEHSRSSRHSITFLCLPLNTTAKAPCPTRSFLLYSKSPTVSIANGMVVQNWWMASKCCSLSHSETLQRVLRVLVMLHPVLQIYFMIGWYVFYCINKGCRWDMVHSHALCRMRCVQTHTEQTPLSLDNRNPELNCISTSCQSLTHLGSLVAALHYDQNRLNILLRPSHLTLGLHDGTSAGHDRAKIESRCTHRAIC